MQIRSIQKLEKIRRIEFCRNTFSYYGVKSRGVRYCSDPVVSVQLYRKEPAIAKLRDHGWEMKPNV